MINRRDFLVRTASSGAALAFTPELLRALQDVRAGGAFIQKAIPSTGEKLPSVGLSFSNHVSCADPTALKAVLKAMVDNGGRVFDALHGDAQAEQHHATVANELGVQSKVFWSVRGTAPGNPAQLGPDPVRTHITTLLGRLNTPSLDLVMLSPSAGRANFDALIEAKQSRRARYIGSYVIVDNRLGELESVMRNEPIDFIGVHYDVGSRRAEETILPLALERKIAVMVFFPLGNNAGASCGSVSRNLFARVGDRPLPEWAAEFDAKSWAQFFLKYVISHPAVTVARVGTTKVAHMLDDIAGGSGRLPDEATRRRMAAYIDALPPLPPLPTASPNSPTAPGFSLSAAILDRYVGEYQAASGFTAIFRRDGDRLWVKPGSNTEAALNARSETRFQDPRGPFFEFQFDAQGKVTGAILEQQGPQGTQRTQLERR